MEHHDHGHHGHDPAAHDRTEQDQAHAHDHGQEHGHDKHEGHRVEMFRSRFWISAILTLPTIVFGHMLAELFGYTPPHFPGSRWIAPLFGEGESAVDESMLTGESRPSRASSPTARSASRRRWSATPSTPSPGPSSRARASGGWMSPSPPASPR